MTSSRNKKKRISAVDLFCGAGGLTFGLNKAGIDVCVGVDLDKSCKYAYERNNKARFEPRSIADLTGAEVSSWFVPGTVRLLAGCAPCQPFSQHTRGRDTSTEPDWSLLDEFGRLVREVSPELVTMENVTPIQHHEVFTRFVATLKQSGYKVAYGSIFCPDYGIPQERRRLVLMASRLGNVSLPKPTRTPKTYKSVKDTISTLPKLAAGEIDPRDRLHLARKLTPLNIKRLKASKPGGTWHDWPKELRSPCHQKESGSSFRSVYARMTWGDPSPTITTQFFNFGTGRFGHPEQDRSLTLREGAMLQTFPKNYAFVPAGKPVIMRSLGKCIGNAVPPKLGEVIGKAFVAALPTPKKKNET
jgi:DNA (cytosine-5)-methyltransferase 1